MVAGLVDGGDLGAGGVVSGTIECSGAAVVGAGNGAAGRVLRWRCSPPSVPTQAAPGRGS